MEMIFEFLSKSSANFRINIKSFFRYCLSETERILTLRMIKNGHHLNEEIHIPLIENKLGSKR